MTNPFAVEKTVEKWIQQAQQEGKLDISPSKRCRVCKDDVIRSMVNKMISRAFSIPDILNTLESHNLHLQRDGKPKITKDCLYNHRARHFDIQSPAGAILRRIQEEEANKLGADWTTGTGTILNAASYLRTMMVRGYETLTNPAILVDVEKGAWASLKLDELIRKDADGYDRARMMADVGRIVEAARTFVPEEQWPAFNAMLRGERLQDTDEDAEPQRAIQMISIDDTPDEGDG